MTHTYSISGMTCDNCVSKVKSELLKMGDVTEAHVQLKSPQATITMQKHIPTNVLQNTISKAGSYRIADVDTSMDKSVKDDQSYYPILLIFGYITVITLLIQLSHGSFNLMQWMSHFMAGFFLVFSFFKLMNLKGFQEGYSMYDVIVKRIPVWGFIYPFIELTLGIAYLNGFQPLVTNIVTLFVMGISSIGVIQSMIKKTQIQCACLGTVIKLPLGKVTLFEDLLMVIMSAVMIIKTLSI